MERTSPTRLKIHLLFGLQKKLIEMLANNVYTNQSQDGPSAITKWFNFKPWNSEARLGSFLIASDTNSSYSALLDQIWNMLRKHYDLNKIFEVITQHFEWPFTMNGLHFANPIWSHCCWVSYPQSGKRKILSVIIIKTNTRFLQIYNCFLAKSEKY